MPHISRGVLLAGPGRGPLRFMECHSVAAAVNQVNVAEPISSVVPTLPVEEQHLNSVIRSRREADACLICVLSVLVQCFL